MEQNKAIQILIDAIGVAQKRGAYSLDEIDVILPAIKTFVKKEEVKEEEVKSE
jgi:hypothetical protein